MVCYGVVSITRWSVMEWSQLLDGLYGVVSITRWSVMEWSQLLDGLLWSGLNY